MTHIIAFMDDTLHVQTRSSLLSSGPDVKRQARVKGQKRMVEAAAAGAGTEPDAAPVRMDRVNALRASIADGSYAVSSADLADKILHTLLNR